MGAARGALEQDVDDPQEAMDLVIASPGDDVLEVSTLERSDLLHCVDLEVRGAGTPVLLHAAKHVAHQGAAACAVACQRHDNLRPRWSASRIGLSHGAAGDRLAHGRVKAMKTTSPGT